MKRILILSLLFLLMACEKDSEEITERMPVKIAFMADIQYCDCDDNGTREYRESLNSLAQSVKDINRIEVDYTIQLGDLIDRNIDSFGKVLPILDSLNSPIVHVLGNHDFNIENRNLTPRILGLENRYYQVVTEYINIVVLDGQEISLFAYEDENHPNVIKARQYLESINYTKKEWNGAMSQEQMNWLENILKTSKKDVLIVSHYPIFPFDGRDNLWNDKEVYNLIEKYDEKLLGYFNGHGHIENIVGKYHTLDGMVEKEGNNHYIFEF